MFRGHAYMVASNGRFSSFLKAIRLKKTDNGRIFLISAHIACIAQSNPQRILRDFGESYLTFNDCRFLICFDTTLFLHYGHVKFA